MATSSGKPAPISHAHQNTPMSSAVAPDVLSKIVKRDSSRSVAPATTSARTSPGKVRRRPAATGRVGSGGGGAGGSGASTGTAAVIGAVGVVALLTICSAAAGSLGGGATTGGVTGGASI